MRYVLGTKVVRAILPNYKEENSRNLLGCLKSDVPIEIVLPILENPNLFDIPEFLRVLNILYGSGKLIALYFDDYKKVIDSFIPYGLLQIAQFKLNMYDLNTGEYVRGDLVKAANKNFIPQLENGNYHSNFYNWYDVYGHIRSVKRTQFEIFDGKSLSIDVFNSEINNKIFELLSVNESFIEDGCPLNEREKSILGSFGRSYHITKEDNFYYVKNVNSLTYKFVADGYNNLIKMSLIHNNINAIIVCLNEILTNSRSWGFVSATSRRTYSVGLSCEGDHRDFKILIYSLDFGKGISKKYAGRYYENVYHKDDKNIFEIALTDGKSSYDNDILGKRGHGFTRIKTLVKKFNGKFEILSGDINYIMDEKLEYNPLGVEESGTLVKLELKLI